MPSPRRTLPAGVILPLASLPFCALGATSQVAQVAGTMTEPVDNLLARPFIDIDEWRQHPVRHRYVRGHLATNGQCKHAIPPHPQSRSREDSSAVA